MSLCVTLRIKSLPLILRFRPHHPCRKTLNSLGASVRFRTPTRTRLLRAVCMLCAAVCVLQYLCALSYIYKGLTFKGSVCVCIALCKCARTCKPTMMSGLLGLCVAVFFRIFTRAWLLRAVCMLQCVCCSVCYCSESIAVCVFQYVCCSVCVAVCVLQCACCSVRVAVHVLHCVGVHELVSLQWW